MARRRPPAGPSKPLRPNFPPKLKLTYKDEEGKTVRIIPTDLNPDWLENPEYDPLWRPRPAGGDGDLDE